MTQTFEKASALRPMLTPSKTALLVAVAISVSGCGLTARKPVEMQQSIPTDYRQRHPITIQEREAKLEIFVGPRRGGLTPIQRADVQRFAGVWRGEGTGGLVIDVPRGTANARAAAESANEIRSALAAAGVPGRAIAIKRYQPEDEAQLATVRVRYPRMAAQAGPCGLWPEDLGLPHDAQPTMNRPYWNLGCSTQRNLASLVANPTDLVQPRGETPADARRRQWVGEQYRVNAGNTIVLRQGSGQ
ncbi:pilus biogenesis CpaD protein, pilus_cpaD [Variibacter gotjawalensis]|uniref:Pilus biogenesis CpaD protein, pilus_cpaD n=1 Tax=Variibacter gotjawalensis TaxID=1333996 RepID=A0A0S3PPD1_9BRAD|nr:CpaD family pilus assembly protein [Variibacter gotjawalensis]NIK48107.1 pilus assembly protein CpaD [Variibacter gotjawalensis]RZS49983.1 pilus assembly protein CpaD [Variibacter gotjawalensis]BAT57810.1 pilus biogenesis CpaD protein, pilus_cpaD [Variibacter gotjawalensis]